jgi:hypothetical protein
MDMAVLVESQGELLDQIEYTVALVRGRGRANPNPNPNPIPIPNPNPIPIPNPNPIPIPIPNPNPIPIPNQVAQSVNYTGKAVEELRSATRYQKKP